MKNIMYYFLVLSLLYWSCQPKENPVPDSGHDSHLNKSHLLRVYPGSSESLNIDPIEQISPLLITYLKGMDFPEFYLPGGCSGSNKNYQVIKINETKRKSLERFKNRMMYTSSSSKEINDLIPKPGPNPKDTIYYERHPYNGSLGCNNYFICRNNKLDSFHYNNHPYIHLPMAYHHRLDENNGSIDTLENYEFRISSADYDALNLLFKTNPILRGGIDSMNHSYLNIFKGTDTIRILQINQVFN